MIKNRKEVADKIKESTRKMYEKTIEEMEEKGASAEAIEEVRKCMESLNAAYQDDGDFIQTMSCLNIDPIRTNLFILKLPGVPFEQVNHVDVDFEQRTIIVSVYETIKFSPLKYFSNKSNKNYYYPAVSIEYYNTFGNYIRRDLFTDVIFDHFHPMSLSYDDERPLSTTITFKFGKYEPTS